MVIQRLEIAVELAAETIHSLFVEKILVLLMKFLMFYKCWKVCACRLIL